MESLVFSNMFHRPARTVVSILGIGVGVLLMIFTYGLANGSLREQAKRDGNVGAELMFFAPGTAGRPGSAPFLLPDNLPQSIKQIDGVKDAVLVGQNSVNADTALGNRVIEGIKFDEYADMVGIHIIQGRQFTDGSDEALIDTGFQNQKKYKIGDTMKMYGRDFKIVGTYEPAAGARVKIPLSTMQEKLGGEGRGTAILISIKKPGATEDEVGARLHEKYPDNMILKTKDLEEIYLQAFPALGVFLNVIIGVAAVISALVILLTMYTTVTERTRQIGVLKSLGMSNFQIGSIITQEAVLISVSGVIAGIVLSFALRAVLKQFITLEVELSWVIMVITLVVGMIGGAIGALYPAMRAARLDAVEALSYE